jgi:hypothetical protein
MAEVEHLISGKYSKKNIHNDKNMQVVMWRAATGFATGSPGRPAWDPTRIEPAT